MCSQFFFLSRSNDNKIEDDEIVWGTSYNIKGRLTPEEKGVIQFNDKDNGIYD